jgi:hypothetical protein
MRDSSSLREIPLVPFDELIGRKSHHTKLGKYFTREGIPEKNPMENDKNF